MGLEKKPYISNLLQQSCKTWRIWKIQRILYLTEKLQKSRGNSAFYPKNSRKIREFEKILRIEVIFMPSLNKNF